MALARRRIQYLFHGDETKTTHLIVPRFGHTESYSENAREYRNLSWDVQQGAGDAAVQLAGKALVLVSGAACPVPARHREPADASAFVVGVELELEADRILDAADETHAGVGLFVHDAAS
jgi:hypothetical protein